MILLLAACDPPPTATLAGECIYDASCGTSQACIDGACRSVECLVSDDCAYGQTCDGYACADGCAVDADCDAGLACEAGSCGDAWCDATLADCPIGQQCEYNTGDSCIVPAGDWCLPCDLSLADSCGGGALCFRWEWEDPDEAYCMPACDPAASNPCPVGFICAEMETEQFYCLANCRDLSGYL